MKRFGDATSALGEAGVASEIITGHGDFAQVPLHEQPIGWEPDINDGVRINIRPFMNAKPLNARGQNACILRVTPKTIKWGKDRGKEPTRAKEDFPWFWGWDERTENSKGGNTFDGNRWNDLHYRRSFKEDARRGAKRGPS